MKRVFYPSLSGPACLICSVSWNDKEIEFYKYFKTITKKGEQTSVMRSLESLGDGTLNKANPRKYHSFSPQFKDPDLYVLKSNAHRFFLVYDKTQINGYIVDIAVIVCCTRKQRDNYTKNELKWMDAARMKYWNNRLQCVDEESKEGL